MKMLLQWSNVTEPSHRSEPLGHSGDQTNVHLALEFYSLGSSTLRQPSSFFLLEGHFFLIKKHHSVTFTMRFEGFAAGKALNLHDGFLYNTFRPHRRENNIEAVFQEY